MDKQAEITKMTKKIEQEPVKKEKVYHVGYNPAVGKIFAGVLNKKGSRWLSQTDVTLDALAAVRDHFIQILLKQENDPDSVGYQWELEDGRTVTLQLSIGEKQQEGEANAAGE